MIEIGGKHFDWDRNKNLTNIHKHGISFKEAATVFQDARSVVFDDLEHSQDEERFVVIGKSRRLRLLMVCHCYRKSGTIIRVISAREANEIQIYGGGKNGEAI
ncbi:MAG: BrnT family toxin [Defluviitaleaceae bacterium]|nr:BrnT family toxin [Defluviitaleaceae bacterium]